MELEELKNIWNQYDKKLNENLHLNEEILKKLNLDKSKREMNTPLNAEIVNVLLGISLLIVIFISTIRTSSETKFLISGIIAFLITLCFLIFSVHRLKLMSEIDYYHSSVIDVQKSINKFKQKFFLYKKLELWIIPIYAITLGPMIPKMIRNYDFFMHPYRFGIAIGAGLAIGYPVALWIYKNWYEKKMNNVSTFLDELNRFEKEE